MAFSGLIWRYFRANQCRGVICWSISFHHYSYQCTFFFPWMYMFLAHEGVLFHNFAGSASFTAIMWVLRYYFYFPFDLVSSCDFSSVSLTIVLFDLIKIYHIRFIQQRMVYKMPLNLTARVTITFLAPLMYCLDNWLVDICFSCAADIHVFPLHMLMAAVWLYTWLPLGKWARHLHAYLFTS